MDSHDTMRLLSLKEVANRVACSRSTIWRMEKNGTFPARIWSSAKRVAWLESEVNAWISAKADARNRSAEVQSNA